MTTAIKDAIYDVLAGDSVLVAMLGAPDISTAWPEENVDFAATPAGVMDYSLLQSCAPPRARITITLINASNDGVIDLHRDDYQIDYWSLSERLNDALAERVGNTDSGILKADMLNPTGARVLEAWCTDGFESMDDNRIHRKSTNCEITWTGA